MKKENAINFENRHPIGKMQIINLCFIYFYIEKIEEKWLLLTIPGNSL